MPLSLPDVDLELTEEDPVYYPISWDLPGLRAQKAPFIAKRASNKPQNHRKKSLWHT